MHKKVFAMVVFGILSAGVVWAADFQPGQYEITTNVEMSGMPSGAIPSQTAVHCLTEQDPVPSTDASGSGCKIKDVDKTGNTVRWAMECTQQGQKMTGSGSMTFSGDKFTGTSTMNMGPQAGNAKVISRMEGRRIGDCEGGQ